MKTAYEKCKEKITNKILKSYEKKGKINVKQSIAIALSISEKQCKHKLNIKDFEKMEIKINKMISRGKIQRTGIKNSIYLLNNYKHNKQYYKKMVLENKILKFIILNNKYDKISSIFIKYLNNSKLSIK